MSKIADGIKGLLDSFGSYARRVVLGVWFPGFLVLCELGLLYYAATGRGAGSFARDVLAAWIAINEPVLEVAVGVLALAAAIALGYVARDLAFWMSDFWLSRGWRPTRSLNEILAQIRTVHGSAKVDEVLSRYEVFKLADDAQSRRKLPRRAESYVREYCKLWLSLKAPSLSTEGIETEINMDLGLVIPLLLAGLIFAAGFGAWPDWLLALLMLAFALLRLYRITWARNIETELAVVNFLVAHWEDLPKSDKAEAGEESLSAALRDLTASLAGKA